MRIRNWRAAVAAWTLAGVLTPAGIALGNEAIGDGYGGLRPLPAAPTTPFVAEDETAPAVPFVRRSPPPPARPAAPPPILRNQPRVAGQTSPRAIDAMLDRPAPLPLERLVPAKTVSAPAGKTPVTLDAGKAPPPAVDAAKPLDAKPLTPKLPSTPKLPAAVAKPAAPPAPAADPSAPPLPTSKGEAWVESSSGPPAALPPATTAASPLPPAACAPPCESACRPACPSVCEQAADACQIDCNPRRGQKAFDGIEFGGWLEQGISFADKPSPDRYNGVVGFNDRDRDYQLNQLYAFVKKDVDTGGCGWDIGGRVDAVFGTDARFTQAAGLETRWNQTEINQLALPQFYADVAVNDWTVRMGHFYTTLGYEVVTAPDNFFYSHAYTMLYGEPFTHTGLLVMRKLNDNLTVNAGFHRGNDQFTDEDGLDRLGFLGGLNWTGPCEIFSYAFNISVDEQGPETHNWVYSMVAKTALTERLDYIVQHDYGRLYGGGLEAKWYGLNQYWLYRINECWAAGARVEWFRDNNGARVTGVGATNTANGEEFGGDFYEVTLGLNWKPRKNILLRPEVRWDWYEPNPNELAMPFTANGRNHQFLTALDLIITF